MKKYTLNMLVAIVLLSAIVIVCSYLLVINKGYNLTDEGFYLLNGSNPEDAKATFSFFGYYLHGIMAISKNIVFLRAFSYVANILSIIVLCWSFLTNFNYNNGKAQLAVLSSSLIVIYHISLIFPILPNYNNLTIIGTIWFLSLIMCTLNKNNYPKKLFFFLLGLVNTFIVFNKFSTGIILFITVGMAWSVLCYRNKRVNLFYLVMFAFGAIVHCSVFFIFYHNINAFIESFKRGLIAIKIMDSGHNADQLITMYLNSLLNLCKQSFITYKSVYFLLIIIGLIKISFDKFAKFYHVMLGFTLCLFFYLSSGINPAWGGERFYQLVDFYLSCIIFLILLAVFNMKLDTLRIYCRDNYSLLLISIFILLLPIIISLGTNNDITMQILLSVYVWMLIIYLLLEINVYKIGILLKYFFIAGVCVFSSYNALYDIYKLPYGLYSNLSGQNKLVEVNGTNLYVDSTTKYIIDSSRNLLQHNGFKNGDFIAGLTDIPGLIYAVGARSPGCPWFFGMYKGSNDFLSFCLSTIPNKIPFIILDHYNGQTINFTESNLKNYIDDFSNNYKKIGEVNNISTNGGVCCKVSIDTIKLYKLKPGFKI